jgi:lysophospholipase L1-like esterase
VSSRAAGGSSSSWRFGNLLAFLFAVAFSFNAAALSVCAVGDSITQGGENFTAHRIALESRFNELGWNVEWKGTRADASWGSDNPCEGYSGKNAVEIAAQYESHASAVAADILLLHAGHNYNAGDANLSPTPMSEEAIITAVTNAHARIIAAARAQNPDVIVLYAKVITSGGNREVKYSYIPALNTAIGALADELNTNVSPVICVDMADGWNFATDCVSDCVHPNATGAAKMAEKWMAAIQPLVNDGKLNVEPKAFGSVLPTAYSDLTVTEDTRLTGDMTVGVLTVEAGVTLDLNGYKLTCSSVVGSGTIISTVKSGDMDITSPSGTFTMVSPSACTKGSVSNIFNDNTYYSQGDKDRLLLDLNKSAQKLPLIIDYDFGDGNKKVVNAYKIYAAWRERAPKAWTLYGSNDSSAYNSTTDDGWTAIHSVSGETSWTKSSGKNYESESRSYGCINSTSYRYYRLKITEHVGSNSYLELVQLEYFSTTPGELHLNVASGEEAQWPSGINFVGNLKIVKNGVGALKATGYINLNEGIFAIKSGTVTVDGVMLIACSSGKAAEVVVDGGTLTVNHSNSIASSATGIVVGYNGVGTLTVNNGIMTVASNRDIYFAWESTGSGVINLNGGTLVSRRLLTKSGSSRILNFNGGILKANGVVSSNGFIANGINVNVGEKGGTIDSGNLSDATTDKRLFVAADIGGTGALRFKGGKTINIDGEVKCEGGSIIELGTKIVASKEFFNKSLKVDGRTTLNATQTYDVLVQGGLTSDGLAKVSLENCASGSEVVLDNPDNPTKIVVNLAAATGIGTETPVLVFPETTLQQIADITGGTYFRATNTAALQDIYKEIDQLEKSKIQVNEYSQKEELYHWFVWAMLACLLAELLLRQTVFKSIP